MYVFARIAILPVKNVGMLPEAWNYMQKEKQYVECCNIETVNTIWGCYNLFVYGCY